MNKPFTIIAVVLFSLIALLQLLRFILGWEATVNRVTVPIWISGIAFVLAAGLAMMLWREARKAPDMAAPYLRPGRLADVIAAIQVMASAERPERKIKDWANEFDRNRDTATIARWASVFQDHREFFITYRLTGEEDLKAALRWRYVLKTFDSRTKKEYTPAEIENLSEEQRSLLTTKPLAGDEIQTLLNTAIGLHTRAMEELGAARWWVPLIAAFLGFGGAILGAVLAALFGPHRW